MAYAWLKPKGCKQNCDLNYLHVLHSHSRVLWNIQDILTHEASSYTIAPNTLASLPPMIVRLFFTVQASPRQQ
jgi:hypothetical protein